VRPLAAWLQKRRVQVLTGCRVTDLDIATAGSRHTVTRTRYEKDGVARSVDVAVSGLVFFTNASMTDASSYGSMTGAPSRLTRKDSQGWALWEKIADGRPDFGRPATFNSSVPESSWESCTVTLKDPAFFDKMEQFSGNRAGTGGLMTFKDSHWMMSIVLAHQPHFAGQPEGVQVFWGFALHPDRIGWFVAKTMADCSGEEILR
jgi:oleate hydratase